LSVLIVDRRSFLRIREAVPIRVGRGINRKSLENQ